MQRRFSGQNLVEILILIAVVVLVGIFVFSTLGGNIQQMLGISQVKVKEFNPFGVNYDRAENYKAGSLGGTPDAPKSECKSGKCAIDYGDFILTGLPENFGEFVETGGSSGGTDSIASLLEQIGDQIVDPDASDGSISDDFKLIANLGHFSADIQEAGELAAKACISVADPEACFNNKSSAFGPLNVTVPEELKSVLTGWPRPDNPTGYSADSFKGILAKIDLGAGAASPITRYTDTYPSIQIMQAYDRIMASDSNPSSAGYDGVTQEMKQIATEMIKQVDKLNDNLKKTYYTIENYPGQWRNYDPITERGSWSRASGSATMSDVINPKTSNGTDIRSKIFCATGNGADIGSKCR